jgi:hypothetical protein
VNHNNFRNGDYTLNITRGEVVHIGQNLNITSPNCITSSSDIKVRIVLLLLMQFHVSVMLQEIFLNCGAVKNAADNVVDGKDRMTFHIESFVSNDAFSRTVCSHEMKF